MDESYIYVLMRVYQEQMLKIARADQSLQNWPLRMYATGMKAMLEVRGCVD